MVTLRQHDEAVREARVRRRIALEKRIVRYLVREMKKGGFLPEQVYQDGEYVQTRTEHAVIKAVFEVDVATIHFDLGKGKNAHSHGVAIVLGNAEDCISDWHIGDEAFNKIVEAVSDWTRELE